MNRAEVSSEVPHRGIRSYVLRGGRITPAQERAWESLWPRYGCEHPERAVDLDVLFGRVAPRVLEIGFGNGDHLLARAAACPEHDFLGIEVHRAGVGHLLLGLERDAIANVRIICHDAVEVLGNSIADESLDEVQILFPDPWHKKRHHKRRLIQPAFVALLTRRLKPGGRLHLATDWEPYAVDMLRVLGDDAALQNLCGTGAWAPRPDSRLPTRFERRGLRRGYLVRDLLFGRLRAANSRANTQE